MKIKHKKFKVKYTLVHVCNDRSFPLNINACLIIIEQLYENVKLSHPNSRSHRYCKESTLLSECKCSFMRFCAQFWTILVSFGLLC